MIRGQSRKHERRAIVALFAVFALAVQALIPAAAMAGPRLVAGDLICVGGRVHTTGDPASPATRKAMAGMPCQDCLMAAMAAVVAPSPDVTPVSYVTARVEHIAAAPLIEPHARGPPRPLGQGPPSA